jgi:hypothetical protein
MHMAKKTPFPFRLSHVVPHAFGEARLALRKSSGVAKTFAIVLVWSIVAIALGLVVGMASILLPPTGAFGLVAIAGLVLLWVLPELPEVPEKLVRGLFFTALIVCLCVPNYYTLDFPGLPWISVRRLSLAPLIVVFSIAVSTSPAVRARLVTIIKDAKWVSICAFGFLAMVVLSVFVSSTPAESMSTVIEILLAIYVPFVAMLYVLRTEKDALLLLRVFGWCALFVGMGGIVEFLLQKRIFIEILPKAILDPLMAQNPTVAEMVLATPFRNGLWRASSIYAVPLSFGEFEGMVAPLGLFYMVHGASVRSRVFGWAIFLTSFFGVVTSGSRGGYISFLFGLSAFVLLWAVRSVRVKGAGSLAPALIGVSVVVGLCVLFGLVMFWHRAHVMVLGGGETAASDNGRSMQWAMAIPKIFMRPLTGWGAGQSGNVIGYIQASGIPSVDSYALTVLVDFGIPGFVFFFGMGVVGLIFGAFRYLTDPTVQGELAGAVACSLGAFTFYRFYLSQWENHLPFFLLVACMMWLLHAAAERRRAEAYDQTSDAAAAKPPAIPRKAFA